MGIVVLIVLGVIAYFAIKIFRAVMKKKAEILVEQTYEQALATAKANYDMALNGRDKRDALMKGRAYYSLLRGGIRALAVDYSESLPAEDEARINTDINSMNI